jgi:phage N-6-adenine-methyltransferase
MLNHGLYMSESVEWSTPQRVFDVLDAEFHFTLDPCATRENAKCAKFYTIEDNGLCQSWDGERVFMNPPYGRDIGLWMRKAYESKPLVVCLIPSRTDTKWWHSWVMRASEIRFTDRRLSFGNGNKAPVASVVVVFGKEKREFPKIISVRL